MYGESCGESSESARPPGLFQGAEVLAGGCPIKVQELLHRSMARCGMIEIGPIEARQH